MRHFKEISRARHADCCQIFIINGDFINYQWNSMRDKKKELATLQSSKQILIGHLWTFMDTVD